MVMLFAFYDFLVVMYYIYISPFFVNLAKGIRKKPIKKNLKKKKNFKKKKRKEKKRRHVLRDRLLLARYEFNRHLFQNVN
jgi:hypothetical protein